MPEVGRLEWSLIGVVWLICAFGSGWLLALLYRRLHPQLSFHRLWAFWTAVVSVVAAAVFLLGLV